MRMVEMLAEVKDYVDELDEKWLLQKAQQPEEC